jgi:hypothetical protein
MKIKMKMKLEIKFKSIPDDSCIKKKPLVKNRSNKKGMRRKGTNI